MYLNCGSGFLIIYEKTSGFRIPNCEFGFGLPSQISKTINLCVFKQSIKTFGSKEESAVAGFFVFSQ